MIVLDEQLLGRGLETAIAHWYPGAVVFITALRPGTIIKDEAIPQLLSQHRESTFVTINETDFWQRVAITEQFCVICFALTDAQTSQIATQLQRLLRHKRFRTKSLRCGMVIRVTALGVQFYTTEDRTPQTLEDW